MSKQLVIRVPDDLADDLEAASRRSGARRSDVVREALRIYLRRSEDGAARPADRVRHLLGSLKSGRPDVARDHRRHVLESLTRGR